MSRDATPQLQRRLGLTLLVLYGTGITVGAGVYVLIGTVAGYAGKFAPWSFVLAAAVMAFTVASYAELATRYPVSAGEAAYVRAAFGSQHLTRFVGLLTIAIAIVSSAAVALGSAGYIREFVAVPSMVLVIGVLIAIGAVASWGILESVVMASIFTLIEVSGLIAIIIAALWSDVPITPAPLPPLDVKILSGIGFASLLAFFAFIGFEDLVNVAEEAKDPHRDLPRAMAITLVLSTILYVSIAIIAVSVVPPKELSASSAPLSTVFRAVAGVSPATISLIAIMATLNTILAQLTMASRVIYGMARQGDLPQRLGKVHAATNTPLIATWVTVAAALVLALWFPLERLAELTSVATLVVFAFVNVSLLQLRRNGVAAPVPTDGPAYFTVPTWVPVVGLATSVAMIAASLL